MRSEAIRAILGAVAAINVAIAAVSAALTDVTLESASATIISVVTMLAGGEAARRKVWSEDSRDADVREAVARGRIEIINEHQQSQNRWELDAELAEGP